MLHKRANSWFVLLFRVYLHISIIFFLRRALICLWNNEICIRWLFQGKSLKKFWNGLFWRIQKTYDKKAFTFYREACFVDKRQKLFGITIFESKESFFCLVHPFSKFVSYDWKSCPYSYAQWIWNPIYKFYVNEVTLTRHNLPLKYC